MNKKAEDQILLNFKEWFFIENTASLNKNDLLSTIKGDIDSANTRRYQQELKNLGEIYFKELSGTIKQTNNNYLKTATFYMLGNPNPLKFDKEILTSFYDNRANAEFIQSYFFSANSVMSPYVPMIYILNLERDNGFTRLESLNKFFSLLVDIDKKFQEDIQKVETEKFSLFPQGSYTPSRFTPPKGTDGGKVNISAILRGG
jgi:hypothetical protein